MSRPSPQVSLAYGPSLSLADARGAIEAARVAAEARGWPMVIAVVDAAGFLVALERLDDAQLGSIDAAIQKARTAVHFRRPTRTFEDGLAAGGVGLRALTLAGISAIDGGIPIVRDQRVVGAIGVSGMLPTEDAEIAAVGARSLMPTTP